MKIVASFKDVKWSLLGVVATMAFNVITLPLMLMFIDSDKMGVWYIFTSLGTLATLFDMGFAVTFARMVAYACGGASDFEDGEVLLKENGSIDEAFMGKIIKICRMIYMLIATTVFILLIFGGSFYIRYVSRQLDMWQVMPAWLLYATAIFLNILFGYYTSLLRGTGNVGVVNRNILIGRMLQLVVLVALLVSGLELIGGAIAYLTYSIVFRTLSRRHLTRYRFFYDRETRFDSCELRDLFLKIWAYAWKEGIIAVSMYITNQASTIICSLYLTLEETGAYSLGTQLAMMMYQISAVYFSAIQPSLQNAFARKEQETLKKHIAASFVFLVGSYLVMSLVLVVAGIPVLKLIRPSMILPMSTLIVLLIYYLLMRIRDCATSYFSSTNRIIYMNSYVISSLLAIVLMVLFAGGMKKQAMGVILGQAISQLIFNFWYWPSKCYRELKYGSVFDVVKIGWREILSLCRKK